MSLEEFKKFTINSIGRINPRSVTEKYFGHINRLDLWQWFIENSNHIENESPTIRLAFLLSGHDKEHPKCYCGKPVGFLDHKVSKYCCKECASKSAEKSEKISKSKGNLDNSKVNATRVKTMVEKYGVPYNSQRPEVVEILKKSKLHQAALEKLSNQDWLNEEYNIKNRSGVDIAHELECYYGTVLDYCRKFGFKITKNYTESLQEIQVREWLDGIQIKHEKHSYDILVSQEIDIVIEDSKLCIELDGLRWHRLKPKTYHLNKTIQAIEAGYQLLHFTDQEWFVKNEIVKSIVANKLGINDKIYARKCDIKLIDNKISSEFLNKNHIQGFVSANITYGLYFNDELVMLMSFGKPRFNKDYDLEVIRVATKLGFSVVGGLSKLLTEFKRENSGSIMTYVDRKYGNGKGMEAVGFSFVRYTEPGYFWTNGNKIISRYKAMKKELVKWLPSFDASKTEVKNMTDAGYLQFWDCGQIVMELK